MLILGDFNDTKDSNPVKKIIEREKSQIDRHTTPPSAATMARRRNQPYFEPRDVAWTYFYGKDDTYERIDYILLSPAMRCDWVRRKLIFPQFQTGVSARIIGLNRVTFLNNTVQPAP